MYTIEYFWWYCNKRYTSLREVTKKEAIQTLSKPLDTETWSQINVFDEQLNYIGSPK